MGRNRKSDPEALLASQLQTLSATASTLQRWIRNSVRDRPTLYRVLQQRPQHNRLRNDDSIWHQRETLMKVGVFTALLSQLPLQQVLEKLKAFDINTVELGTGNYPGDAHCKLSMLENSASLAEFRSVVADHGATISALSCHGNPLHPDKDRARAARETSRKTACSPRSWAFRWSSISPAVPEIRQMQPLPTG